MPQNLTVAIRHNPSLDYTTLPRQQSDPVNPCHPKAPLDLNVGLRRDGTDGLFMYAFRPGERSPRTTTHHARLTVSARTVLAKAARLRSVWRDRLVHYQPSAGTADGLIGGYPFAESTDLSHHAVTSATLTTELAEEGHYLLECLLEGTDLDLCAFRDFLTGTLRDEEGLRASFDSDLYLPWPMLAVGTVDPAAPWSAFLGHRHQIEQTGAGASYYQTIDNRLARRALPVTSLNTDSTLEFVGRAPEVRKLLEERSRLTVRTESGPLFEALSGAVVDEDLMYFWCHGHFVENGSPYPHLAVQLSDDRRIDADSVLIKRRRFKAAADAQFRPFVVLNACHSGQAADGPELEHLGKALIRLGADGVLGPQIEIPQIFATEYAYAFLDLYLSGEYTAGEITQRLVRHFVKEFHNPLALTYSLHCGIDSRLELAQ
ncbi:CHAT domain-containing protein [Streptomyces sp. NPDC042319]|uniref:CHAT domain-containing protein n=1 Tax=Streptomyces sp. NPDC042319 TaxID=3154332 RepID=UPI0034066FFC